MLALNFKDFLTSGVCLQTGPDRFKLLAGPFVPASLEEIHTSKSSTFLYKANFWDFLNSSSNKAQNFVYSVQNAFDLDREEFIRLLEKEDRLLPDLHWEKAQDEDFKVQFDWSQNLFKKGELKKTVPIIVQHSKKTLTIENLKALLLNLLKRKNFGWTYAFFSKTSGMIGHTPEMLLDWYRAEQRAYTDALAGTVAIGEGAHHEITNDTKIRQEHNYVIDDIQLKLAGFFSEKEPTEVLELKHLLHLQTRFLVKIDSVKNFLKCVECLHPTAAMGLYPNNTDKLKEFSQFEIQKKRGPFAGPIGFVVADHAQVLVPIRNIIFNDSGSSIYSGCGITAESRYESELAELESKRNSVKKMLGLMHD